MSHNWHRLAVSANRQLQPCSRFTPLIEGDVLKQPDLACGYRALAAEGADWFHQGPFAKAVGVWQVGGLGPNGKTLVGASEPRFGGIALEF